MGKTTTELFDEADRVISTTVVSLEARDIIAALSLRVQELQTVQHADGACMAGVWKQSAELLQERAETAEAIIADLWDLIPPQEPSREFIRKAESIVAALRISGAARTEDQHVSVSPEHRTTEEKE